jgi:hypothetical protein
MRKVLPAPAHREKIIARINQAAIPQPRPTAAKSDSKLHSMLNFCYSILYFRSAPHDR